jgi:tetratricopeptide (TPR) repeat protein
LHSGLAYYNLCDYSRAIADFTQAIKIDPNYGMAYNNRGLAYLDADDRENAAKDARKACELGDCNLLQSMDESNKTFCR